MEPASVVAGGGGVGPTVMRLAGGFVGGMVASGAWPPLDMAALVLVGLAIGLVVARSARSWSGALAVGCVWGVGYFLPILAWSGRFGPLPWILLTASQAAFFGPVAWTAWHTRHRRPAAAVAATAAMAVLAEAVRTRAPLGGLEWGQLGVAAHGLPVQPAAAVVGALGVSALIVAVGAALAIVAASPRRGSAWPTLVATIAVAATFAALGALPWTQPAGMLEIAVVQTAAPCPGRAAVDCPREKAQLLGALAASTAALKRPVDLIIWGEGVLSAPTPRAAGRELVAATGRLPAPLLAGVTSPAPEDTFFNRNVLFAADGTLLDAYAKRQPVPFGEYVPGRRLLGGIREVGRLVPRDMRRGGPPSSLDLGEGELGTVSSWEVTFSRLVRDVAADSQAVVVLTTQATYERGAVSDQLLRAAQLRAAELQRSVVVAATTGRSVVITPDGSRGHTTRLYGSDRLADTVELRTGATPFARTGHTPAVLTGLSTAFLVLLREPLRRRRGLPWARAVTTPPCSHTGEAGHDDDAKAGDGETDARR